MKVALVHEWFTTIGGSEKVIKEIASLFPLADIFTLVAIPETVTLLGLENRKLTTSFIQRLPGAAKRYRSYLPLFPLAIEQFDLTEYDLVISSSHAVAKGVLTHSGQIHICYCHSPIRYAWDLQHQYLREAGLTRGLKAWLARYILHRIRSWDILSVNRVDHFVANSAYIAKRISKIYRRDSHVIWPNVDVSEFSVCENKDDFYFTCSRMVPYKKFDVIIEAFNRMPERKLIVIGDGPDIKKLKSIAKSNVVIMGFQPFMVLADHLTRSRAFVFAAEEDFGIIPVEAQACGTPVIAYGKGGVSETVIEGVTGTLFWSQTPEAIIEAVKKFESIHFDSAVIRKHAEKFSTANFREKITNLVNELTGRNKQ